MVIHNLSTTHPSDEWVKIHFPHSVTKERDKIHLLSKQFELHPVFLYHLFLNGINNEEKLTTFLSPNLEDLHSPFLLNEMEAATDRIHQAIEREEEIIIFGDYDCGATRF